MLRHEAAGIWCGGIVDLLQHTKAYCSAAGILNPEYQVGGYTAVAGTAAGEHEQHPVNTTFAHEHMPSF